MSIGTISEIQFIREIGSVDGDGGNGGNGGNGASDTTPDAFTFTDVANANFSTEYTSNEITVAGIDAAAAISITGGTYSINGGAFTADPGTVEVDDTVRVKVTSSDESATAVNAALTIGGVSDTYSVTTYALQSETSTLLAAFTSEPTGARKMVIDDLVAALKTAGVWTKLDALYVLAAHDAQAARQNWKNPAAFALTLHGTANPTFTADSGYTTDGVDNYLDTNFNPATAGGVYAQNSACFGIWSATAAGSATSAAGWFDGTDGVTLNPRHTTDIAITRINQATNTNSQASSITDGAGFMVLNRSGASAQQIYWNGVSLPLAPGNPAQASTALNSATLRLGSITAASFRTMGYRAAVIGQSLNSTEQDALYDALLAYLQAVGAV